MTDISEKPWIQNQCKTNPKAMGKYIEKRLQITQGAVFFNLVFYQGDEKCPIERNLNFYIENMHEILVPTPS